MSHGFGHIRIDCANYKMAKGKAMAAFLIDNESKSSDSSENSSSEENLNYMAFASSVGGKSCNNNNVSDHQMVFENEFEHEANCRK